MIKRKKTITALLITGIFVMLVSSGCYTKFYRPGMEIDSPYSSTELYNRYDSSAIDTTLEKGDVFPEYYPDYNYGWNSWGSYNYYPQTRWGFDFHNFSPGYYHTYYGYNDYYGTPWWNRYGHNNNWWYRGHGGGYNSSPGEPAEKRDERRRRESYNGGGGATYNPPAHGGAPVSSQPSPQTKPAPSRDRKDTGSSSSGSTQKRTGKRRR